MGRHRVPPVPGSPTTDLRRLAVYVPVDLWVDVMDRADAAGMSASRYVRTLIERDELDAEGRPLWAPPAPPTREELPLAQSA